MTKALGTCDGTSEPSEEVMNDEKVVCVYAQVSQERARVSDHV
jgi:hypothetical protein